MIEIESDDQTDRCPNHPIYRDFYLHVQPLPGSSIKNF